MKKKVFQIYFKEMCVFGEKRFWVCFFLIIYLYMINNNVMEEMDEINEIKEIKKKYFHKLVQRIDEYVYLYVTDTKHAKGKKIVMDVCEVVIDKCMIDAKLSDVEFDFIEDLIMKYAKECEKNSWNVGVYNILSQFIETLEEESNWLETYWCSYNLHYVYELVCFYFAFRLD